MEKYMPDIYCKSIYSVDYESLKKNGIKCLLIDLDNTIAPLSLKKPNKKIKDLFIKLQQLGFKVIIFSNSSKNRIKPFKDELVVDCAFCCHKPMKNKFLLIMREFKFSVSEMAIIGDNIVTDILGGNKVGITSILVNPISNKERLKTKVSRIYERYIMNKLRKKDLFKKGKYYE